MCFASKEAGCVWEVVGRLGLYLNFLLDCSVDS